MTLHVTLSHIAQIAKKCTLSASPQCSYPDAYFHAAFDTVLFNYFWVQFFNNPSCGYSEANTNAFVISWNQWTTSLKRSKIFLRLPASQVAALSGYVPAHLLTSKVPNHGALMLWSRNEDRLSGYTTNLQIGSLCTPQRAVKCRNHDSGFKESFGYMSSDSIKVYESENLGGQCCETICWNNCSCESYAAVNQVNNPGCHIWLKGTRFNEDVDSKGLSIYAARHKGMPYFLTCGEL